MDQLKTMKEQLICQVQGQLGHLESVDAKELGEVIDCIKDLAEASYYCSITEAMEEGSKEAKYGNTYYYTMPYDDYNRGRMYYNGNQGGGQGSQGGNSSGGQGGSRSYTPYSMNGRRMYTPEMREYEYMPEMMMHDPREGRAMNSRRMYMESKEMHHDSATQMKELEKYIQDLGEDITEMIQNATPEEKQVLQQKIATLSTKIK